MTIVPNNTFTGPNEGVSGGYVPLTIIESTDVDADLTKIKNDLDIHLSTLQSIYTKLDTIDSGAKVPQLAPEIVSKINASAELIDVNNLATTVAELSDITTYIAAHKTTTTQSDMHGETSIKSTGQTYSETPISIVTSCQNVLDEINNLRIQIHKIVGKTTWIDTPDSNINTIKTKLDTIETAATTDQTAAEIRTLVESASDSNVFTNTDHSKLNGIEIAATADQTGAEIISLINNSSNIIDDNNIASTIARDNDINTHANLTATHGVSGTIQGSEDKNVANGIAGLDASIKLTWSQIPLPMLTVAQFQVNIATGSATNPERINNNSVFGSSTFNVVGEYAEVLFPHPMFISEYRQYGENGTVGDGTWKIQIYHDGAWHDNTLGIFTLGLNEWSAWTPLTIPVYTQGLRLVATILDTAFTCNFIQELEIRG